MPSKKTNPRTARELIESQEISRELLETAAQGVFVVDVEERVAWVNEAACRMFGYRRGEIPGRKLDVLIPEDLRKIHSAHTAGYFARPRRRAMGVGLDLMARRKDGSLFPVEVALSHVRIQGRPLAVAFVSDISLRKQSEREIAEHRQRLRQLTNRLVTASEDETRRWARELHDVYSQRLVSIAFELEKARREGAAGSLPAIEAQIRSLAEDVHGMSRRMHPSVLHDLGLTAALKSELTGFTRETGVQVDFHAENVPAELAPDVALCLYRVAQEALTNIRKHAHARHARVALAAADGVLTMTIQDGGNGFDPAARAQGGLGLLSMEERVHAIGGQFSIASSPGGGTRIEVCVRSE